MDDEITDRAAALSFYLLSALFPTLLFLTALFALMPIDDLMDRLNAYLARVLPEEAAAATQKTLAEITGGARGGLLSIGVLLALWSGSSGMTAVITALNIAFDVKEPRPWWKRRLVAVALTVGFGLFIASALVLMVFGPKVGAAIAGWFGLGSVFTTVWHVVSVPLVILLALVTIQLVYYLAPGGRQEWQWLTPGAVVALVLWLGASFGLRVYVSNFADYSVTYGSIGGVILLMLWLYLTAIAILLGAEVNAAIEHAAARHGATTLASRPEPEPVAAEGRP
jgi:membrane protein